MLEKIFGIMRRAYYVIAGLMVVGCLLSAWDKYEYSRKDFGSDSSVTVLMWQGQAAQAVNEWLIGAILIFPVAYAIHKIVHWITWGKLK